MADENSTPATETEPAAVEPAGLDVDATVADIAESLRLVEETPKEEGADGAPEAKPVEGEKPAGAKPAEEKPAEAAPTGDDVPPDTWKKEAKAKWATVDPELKAEIRRREGDIAKHVAETKPAVDIAQGFQKMLEPFAPLYKQYGGNPWTHIPSLLAAHATLMVGTPEQKVGIMRQFAKDAGLDVGKLGQEGTAAAENPLLEPFRQLQSRLAQLERGVTSVNDTVQTARVAELESGILAFAQDEEKHPFFWDVTESIQHFINTGAANTLEKAYELAVYADPVVRTKLLEKEAKKTSDAQAKANAAKVAAARKASSANVRVSGKGRNASPVGSIEDTLREELANIRSRESH